MNSEFVVIELRVGSDGLGPSVPVKILFLPTARKPGKRSCAFAFVFNVLWNGLLRYILDTCPNL